MSVTRNFGRLDHIALTNKPLMRELALLARERIILRTRQGRDADGAPFRPYSPGYAARKRQEVAGPTQPNLTLSGAMLGDISILSVSDDTAELGFNR